MPLLWTTDDEIKFHQAVVRLSKLRQTPHQEVNYRQQYRESRQSSDHVLRLQDEMQLADHVAYLAHSSEGFEKIAAVCVEEQPDRKGLIIRLARNELRDTEEVESIRGLLRILEDCARGSPDRSAIQNRLFNEAVAMSENRILQRLVPPWYPAPSHWSAKQRQKRTSLRHRMMTSLLPEIRGSGFDMICQKLTQVVEALEPLESKQSGPDLRRHVKIAVQCCANVSTGTEQKSLELQLKPALDQLSEAARKVIAQIDKIARYLNLGRDLTKVVMRQAYRKILQHITLQPLLSPSPILPKGTANLCVVHAEVQLLLHYEQTPCSPAPRFIGCSKSACFLCDLLIKRHGKFHISFSHQRLYPKWTLPNVGWMTQKQVKAWRKVINDMTQELQAMILKFTSDKLNHLSAPMESRACLPLSSTLSAVAIPGDTLGLRSPIGDSRPESPVPQQDLPSVGQDLLKKDSKMLLSLCNDDLPLSYKITTHFPGFQFVSSQLTVFFEFDLEFSGTISLTMETGSSAAIQSIAVDDLVRGNDSRVAPTTEDGGLGLLLQVGGINLLYVELTRDSA
ncbi:hypothetical protein CABS02_13787 [Colletotrichum abscissum]|uniref:Uncharacterized protein n=1 Tax=Colletotrichum abscissum TaxID=1671311 RepID=A0A9P9X2I9_9PEZI|nr:hypothetical protein CABS02_13787 [Colletotrichum abscissum]